MEEEDHFTQTQLPLLSYTAAPNNRVAALCKDITVLMMPSVRRLAINIVTMLLVFFITKGESVSINIVCERKNILRIVSFQYYIYKLSMSNVNIKQKQLIKQC
jgi:hypothetical protein